MVLSLKTLNISILCTIAGFSFISVSGEVKPKARFCRVRTPMAHSPWSGLAYLLATGQSVEETKEWAQVSF